MRERVLDAVHAWGRPLTLRYPELYILRVQLLAPLVGAVTVLAVLAAAYGDVSQDIDLDTRVLFGLVCSLAVGLTWAFLVARDGRRHWPAGRWKRSGLLLIALLSLVATTVPPLAYGWSLSSRMSAEGAPCGSADGYAVDDYQSPACEAQRWHARNSEDLCAIALAGAGLVLALLILVRETSPKSGLIGTACFVAYFTAWFGILDTFGGTDRTVGVVATMHWWVLALMAALQWAARSSSWTSRATSILLALITPFGCSALLLAGGDRLHQHPVAVVFWSYGIYLLSSPFVHGNLVRLRYLPQP